MNKATVMMVIGFAIICAFCGAGIKKAGEKYQQNNTQRIERQLGI